MLQLGIHGAEILQKQFDGIDLPLTEQSPCGLGRRRRHDGRKEGQDVDANAALLLPLNEYALSAETQAWFTFFGGNHYRLAADTMGARQALPPFRSPARASRCRSPGRGSVSSPNLAGGPVRLPQKRRRAREGTGRQGVVLVPPLVMAMARRHHGFIVTALLGLLAVLVLGPDTARATRHLSGASGSLADSPAGEVTPGRGASETARDLEEQAGALYNAGRYEDALRAQRDSVESHRRLVAQDPSQSPRLAAALHNLGVVLIRLDRKSEAIAPTAEALALYRARASTRGQEASRALERPLRNLVLLYYETNRPSDALPLADELVDLHQDGSEADPGTQASLMDVLNLRASLLVALNRSPGAMRDLESAVAIARRQARQAPDHPGLRHGLAGSLLNLSQVADLLGELDQAIPPALEAEGLLRDLARLHPAVWGDWAKALSRLGQSYAKTGDGTRARPLLEEAVGVMRALDPAGPSGTLAVEVGGWRDDLAHALETLALVHQQLQQPREARTAGEEALGLYSVLAQTDPRFHRDVERMRTWLTTRPAPTPAQR
jgi:tetratricopeptide (TPR) repeat protein